MFRFLHAADLHLDSPLHGLDRYEGAPVEVFRRAGRGALENLVRLAIEQEVQFVLLAGDVFDGDWPDVNTGLFFVSQMGKLRDKGILVYMVSGNHDAANRMSRSLPYPDNVYLFPSEQPTSRQVPNLPVVIHGQSYRGQEVQENLAAGYPPPASGSLNIGLLHTALEGREGHLPYAPCRVEQLTARGYDYWALGHVHQRESVFGDGRPLIEFPGNTQGRHVRETGPKGCLLVEVDDNHWMHKSFHPLDVCRWACVEVDCRGVERKEELLERAAGSLTEAVEAAEDRPLAARVVLSGVCPLHRELLARREVYRDMIRAKAVASAPERVWIEKVEVQTTAPSESTAEEKLSEDAVSEINRVVRELWEDTEKFRQALETEDWKRLWTRLPPELQEGEDALNLSDAQTLQAILEQAKALLLEGPDAKEDRR